MSQFNEAALWGGYQSDESKEFKASGGGAIVFGLNTEAKITLFEYSTKTGQGGTEGNPAICITFEIGGQNFNTRIYNPGNKVYFKGKEITDKNSPDYFTGLKQQIDLTKALVTHYLKSVNVPEAQIQANLASMTSFESLAVTASNAMKQFMPTAKVDVFAHYQANIGKTADRTFLEIPTDLAYGPFLAPSTVGVEWKETDKFTIAKEDGTQEIVEGLAYVTPQGIQHKFTRDSFFLKSKRATEQTKAQGATANTAKGGSASPFTAPSTTPPTPVAGTQSNWGA